MKKFTLLLLLLFAMVSLQAQDYLISFAGTGASTTVGTVTVENLTQGKSITLSGTEVLHLVATGTGIDPILDNENTLRIFPNPTTGNSTVEFVASASGITNIELFDIAGRRIGAAQNTLAIGAHSYQVSGLRSGIYTVRITSPAYFYTGKLVSNGAPGSNVKISYNDNGAIAVTAKMLKSASAEKIMQYTTGDRLKFTSTSGNYTTITTDIPTQSKKLTFSFVACTDGDGNNYPVVQIGTQVWMGENLKTTKYRNGSPIPNVTDNNAWFNLTTGAYCWYNNDAANKTTYGALYNWYTVNTGKLAPTGWHVPTDAEWTTLENYLITNGYNYDGTTTGNRDTNNLIAKALASATGWNSDSDNTGSVGNTDYPAKRNATGFTALPGGVRDRWGAYWNIGSAGYWWSSTEGSFTGNAWKRYFLVLDSRMSRYISGKEDGFSVRCVRDEMPTITTAIESAITATTALSGGNITSDGGAAIIARGVCWATSLDPTTANSKTDDGVSTGSFTSTVTGLTANTTYYLRAYATNSIGTSYGNEISFKTFTETVTDIDGNVYNTVTIGSQVWMVENLKTTKYRDGSPIPNVTNDVAWSELKTGAQCNYNNDVANGAKYGKLYNGYAVLDSRNIAPTGWHVSTDAEWTTLETYVSANLGTSGSVVQALGSKTDWPFSPTIGAVGNDLTKNNSTGFTALPGGYRISSGAYLRLGLGVWWSPSELSESDPWIRIMGYSGRNPVRDFDVKSGGNSVRCVKD